MNKLTAISKKFNESAPEIQTQIVEDVYQKITYFHPLATICEGINQKQVRVCPDCGKTHIILYGKRKSIQYYFCKSCGRYFNEFSGTTVSYIKKKEKIKRFIFLMLSGYSLSLCSKSLNIAIQTSFDWRHKILSTLYHFVPNHYCGIAEMIQVEVEFSRKGQGRKSYKIGKKGEITDSRVNKKKGSIEKGENKPLSLVAISDRSDHFEIKIVQQGDLQIEVLSEQIGKKLSKVKKLCIDDQVVLKKFAGRKKISYFINKKTDKVRGCNKYYHTKNIQHKYSKFNGFMERFHGVSSSYLQNYLNWYVMLDLMLHSRDRSEAMIEKSISIPNGKEDYKRCKMFE